MRVVVRQGFYCILIIIILQINILLHDAIDTELEFAMILEQYICMHCILYDSQDFSI